MQDAINEILTIINHFSEIYKIAIVEKDVIIVYWTDEFYHQNTFTNAIELLKWCEENLDEK